MQQNTPVQPIATPAFFQLGLGDLFEHRLFVAQHSGLPRQPRGDAPIDALAQLRQQLQTNPVA